MSAGVLLLPVFVGLVGLAYFQTRNPLHPFFPMVAIFTILVAVNFTFAEPLGFFPLRYDGLGAVVLAFTALAAGVVGATWAYPPRRDGVAQRLSQRINPDAALAMASVLFALCVLSNAVYWIAVQQRLGLAAVIARPGLLKAAELSGNIDLSNPIYFFRVTLLVPVALAIAVYLKPDRRLPRIMLGLYLLMALGQVRRDPIIHVFAAALAVATVATYRLRSLAVPLAAGFAGLATVSVGLLLLLSNLRIPLGRTLFGYTATLSSFQAVLDGFYPPVPQQPLEHTLYVFYSLFKYVDQFVSPANIVRPNPAQPLLPNTYTFLADYYQDAGIAGLVIFPFLVGVLIAVAYGLATRRPSFVTLSFFAAVYGAAAMSFVNNEWSWFMIPMTVVYAALATVFLLVPCTALTRFWLAPRPRPLPAGSANAG